MDSSHISPRGPHAPQVLPRDRLVALREPHGPPSTNLRCSTQCPTEPKALPWAAQDLLKTHQGPPKDTPRTPQRRPNSEIDPRGPPKRGKTKCNCGRSNFQFPAFALISFLVSDHERGQVESQDSLRMRAATPKTKCRQGLYMLGLGSRLLLQARRLCGRMYTFLAENKLIRVVISAVRRATACSAVSLGGHLGAWGAP